MGVIYILTNKAFSNLVKIGYADDLSKRVAQLNSSDALPYPFEVYAYYTVPSRLTDLKLHGLIDKLNPSLRTRSVVNGRTRVREFFELSPEDAYSILEAIAEISDTKNHLVLYKDVDHCHNVTIKENVRTNSKIVKPTLQRRESDSINSLCCVGDIENQEFIFVSTKIIAYMKYVNRNYVVLKGSQLQYPNSPVLQTSILNLRNSLEKQNKIEVFGDIGTLMEDISFASASAAAKFVCGSSRDGWVAWKDQKGNLLDTYRNSI